MQAGKARNIGLDLVRAVAIILVMISHGRIFQPDHHFNISGFEFDYLPLMSIGGFLGVELFFVLSGYLIGDILYRIFQQDKVKLNDLFRFLKRRWIRTLPNYFLFVLLLLLIGFMKQGSVPGFWRYLLFLQNFDRTHLYLFPVSWSLSIEEWFYLLSPFLMLLTGLVFKKNAPVATALLMILLFNITRIGNYFSAHPDWSFSRSVVLLRLDAIAYGVLLVSLRNHFRAWFERNSKTLLLIGASMTVVLSLRYFASCILGRNNFFDQTLLFTLVDIGFVLMLPGAEKLKLRSAGLKNMIERISLWSYSLYLIHVSIVIDGLLLWSGHIHWTIQYAAYVLLSFLLAALCYRYYESSFLRWRERIAPEK